MAQRGRPRGRDVFVSVDEVTKALHSAIVVTLLSFACDERAHVAHVAVQTPEATPAAASSFRSLALVIETESAGKIEKTAWEVKGNKVRFEAIGDSDGVIYIADRDRMTVFAVVAAKKLVVVAPIKPPGEKTPNPVLEKSGHFDRVAGERCEIVVGHYTNGNTSEMCVVALPVFAAILGLGADLGGFPFRAVLRDASGKLKLRIEVTSVVERPINDSRFEPPRDYTRKSPDELTGNQLGAPSTAE